MSRRSKRLKEKQDADADEGKREDRRLSAGDVLGLQAPTNTPNLRTAEAMSAAEAAAATLDAYNAGEHVDDGNTTDEAKSGDSVSSARARTRKGHIYPRDQGHADLGSPLWVTPLTDK